MSERRGGRQADVARAQEVKRAHEIELLEKANVVGVGVGLRTRQGRQTGEVALVVMVTRKVPRAQLAPEDVVPNEIDGLRVDIQEVGELTAQE